MCNISDELWDRIKGHCPSAKAQARPQAATAASSSMAFSGSCVPDRQESAPS